MKPLETPSIYRMAPSILAGNHIDLRSSVEEVKAAGAQWLHVDIMDGHFVPNLTFGPEMVRKLREVSDLFFDVHLMLDEPHRYIEPFAKAGADLISVHVEPEYDIAGTLSNIRALGCRNGIVMNPDATFDKVEPYLHQVDLVLQMTVFPGFGGQSFITSTTENLTALKNYREQHNLNYRIEVDGGIDLDTIDIVKAAGADTFVSGSAFFRHVNKEHFVNRFETAQSKPYN